MPETQESARESLFQRIVSIAISVVAIVFVIYQLIAPFHIFVDPNQHQMIHLTFAMMLIFGVYIKRGKVGKIRWLAIGLGLTYILMALFSAVYSIPQMNWLQLRGGDPSLPFVYVAIGVCLTIVSLEATRQTFGLPVVIVTLAFVLYAYLGHLLPVGDLYIPSVSLRKLFLRFGVGSLGSYAILGPILGISANSIFLFFIYGALLQATGAIKFFIQVGNWVGTKMAGGPALAAVVTSALFGMTSGSAAANIAVTGSFTIPLMKKAGYQPYQAAAIEAMASTGGQLMPPMMGLSIFMMVALTGIPYVELIVIAVIPAVLYFFGGGLYAQFQAMKMRGRGELKTVGVGGVNYREMAFFAPLFILPLVMLIILLLQRHSVAYSITLTLALLVILSLLRKGSRGTLKGWIEAITQGAITGAGIAAVCASIGILLASLSFTGLAIMLPKLMVSISGEHLIALLFLAALSSIILGMAASTVPAYILVVLATVPALLAMGISMAQAHFFSVYFAIMAMLTPPVAISAMVAAKFADAPYMKVGWEGTKVALAGFIIPFFMIYTPIILLQPASGTPIIWQVLELIACFAAIAVLQVVVCGQYLVITKGGERLLFGLLAVILLTGVVSHVYIITIAGMIAFTIMTIWQRRRAKLLKEQKALSRFS